jgi:hypothetical protein
VLPVPSPIEEAILRTLLYADVFNFPMTEVEIHHFLIGCTANRDEVQATLNSSTWLREHITCEHGYYMLIHRIDIVNLRRERDKASMQLWPLACRWGVILAHLPFVRMVALTGALALRNANGSHDDIDYLLVTKPGRVWLARAFAVLTVRIGRLFGVGLCPNYVLAETALLQERQDLFMAHELAQMVPLAGIAVYTQMRTINAWATELLPNTDTPFYTEPDKTPIGFGRWLQHAVELLLGDKLGDALENWEQQRKLRKFSRMINRAESSAQLDSERVKGHFNDYGYPTLQAYEQRLQLYKLNSLEKNFK